MLTNYQKQIIKNVIPYRIKQAVNREVAKLSTEWHVSEEEIREEIAKNKEEK